MPLLLNMKQRGLPLAAIRAGPTFQYKILKVDY